MDSTGRIRGMMLAAALLPGAGCMNESGTHADGTVVSVPGETSPPGPEPEPDADRALRSDPSDTVNALHITLPEAREPDKKPEKGVPLQVGFHRGMPAEYQADLTSRIEWVALGDGALAGTVLVTSPGALAMRMGVLADLPPGGEIRFFGADRTQHFPVTTRGDILWKGAEPEILWSPAVEGDTIGIEIVLPSEESPSSFSFEIDRISHIYLWD